MVVRVQVLIYCLHVITMRRYIQMKPAAPLAPFQLPANLIMYGLDGGPRHLVVIKFIMPVARLAQQLYLVGLVVLNGLLPKRKHYMHNTGLAHVPRAAMSVSVP